MADDASLEALLTAGFRYALALTGERSAAEDALQDGWVALLNARGPREHGYLFRCIRSRFVDRYRRSRLVALDPLPTEAVEALAGPAEESEIEARIDARSDRVAEALAGLRAEEREALYLHAVEGFTASEVGELTGRSRGTVLSLLHRARGKLRTQLAEKEASG